MVSGTMTPSDALLWAIDRDPVLRPTITAVVLLDRPPRWESLVERVLALVSAVPRFRCRVAPPSTPWGRPRWVDDGSFDLAWHLKRVGCPPPGDLRSVLDLAQAMATTGFDHELPLWEAVVVEGMEGGRSAVVVKLHHAMIDGVGGLAVTMGIVDPDGSTPQRPRRQGEPPAAPGGLALPPALRGPVAAAVRMGRLPWRIAAEVAEAAAHPAGSLRQAQATARSTVRLVAPHPTPISTLLGPRGKARQFEAFDLPLDDLRQSAAAYKVTVNDVFVSAILAGLGRYHRQHGTEAGQLRALMPISIRRPDDPVDSNRFVPARFVLPVAHLRATELVEVVHRLTSEWKGSRALDLSDSIAWLLDRLPGPVTASVFGAMLKGTDFVATNVPGPPVEVHVGGAKVESFYAFAPPSGAAVNVALVTLAQVGSIGVNIDRGAVPDSAFLVSCLRQGFDQLCAGRRRSPR